jgi:Na+/H+ antiporter NhaD/arsenite permease-like protein
MPDLTQSWFGLLSLGIFALAYVLVIFEETLHLRKSKPVLLAAGLIWALLGTALSAQGQQNAAGEEATHMIADFGELFLFLIVAIAYVNSMEERRCFDAVRAWLSARALSYRVLFWLLGITTFLLSSVLANIACALVMGAVVMAVGKAQPRFIVLSFINVVVASNAGGAFSPFGDITTLMVWQQGKLEFAEFFRLLLPAIINWLVPAAFMSLAVPRGSPAAQHETVRMKPGALGVAGLFALTIGTAVAFHNFLGLPAALGMMLGLGYLQIWSYILQQRGRRNANADMLFNSFAEIGRIEWDTILFFFGIIFAVGGLGIFGYLNVASQWLYAGQGATVANILLGLVSAIVDNVPLMFAVLKMNPDMNHAQWLLVTLTAGVGGSLLSIGSAAGIALMGLAPESYTFKSHLKWTWAIALGYAASIVLHLVLNGA